MAGPNKFCILSKAIGLLLLVHLQWSPTTAQGSSNETVLARNETFTNSTPPTNFTDDAHIESSSTGSSIAVEVPSTPSTPSTQSILTSTLPPTTAAILTTTIPEIFANVTLSAPTPTVTESSGSLALSNDSNVGDTISDRNVSDSTSLGVSKQTGYVNHTTTVLLIEKPVSTGLNNLSHIAPNVSALNKQAPSGNCTGFPVSSFYYLLIEKLLFGCYFRFVCS